MRALRWAARRARPAKPGCARPANGGGLARADGRAADRARSGPGRRPSHGWRAQEVELPGARSALAGQPLARQLAPPAPARMAARLASVVTALVCRAARSR